MTVNAEPISASSGDLDSSLPPKSPNVHRWILMTSHYVPADRAAQLYNAAHEAKKTGVQQPINLEGLKVVTVQGLGCVDCSLPYGVAWKRPCPARDVTKKGR